MTTLAAIAGWLMIIGRFPSVKIKSRLSIFSFATLFSFTLAATAATPQAEAWLVGFIALPNPSHALTHILGVVATVLWSLVCLNLPQHQTTHLVRQRAWLLGLAPVVLVGAVLIWGWAFVHSQPLLEGETLTPSGLVLGMLVKAYALVNLFGIAFYTWGYEIERNAGISMQIRSSAIFATQIILSIWLAGQVAVTVLILLGAVAQTYSFWFVSPLIALLIVAYVVSLLPDRAILFLERVIDHARYWQQFRRLQRLETRIAELLQIALPVHSARQVLRAPEFELQAMVTAIADHYKALRRNPDPWAQRLAFALEKTFAEALPYPALVSRLVSQSDFLIALSKVPVPPESYAIVGQILRRQEETFWRVSALLPREQRQAMRVAFAFFRVLDDMVDKGQASPPDFLARRQQAFQPVETQIDPLGIAWADIRERHHVNPQIVQELLDGIESDLTPRRYETLDDLCQYCYQVAATVGLLSIPFVGLKSGVSFAQAAPYAIKLCIAMQLTNILKDVGEDLAEGRIYLPSRYLTLHGLSYADIEARLCDDRFKQLVKHLIADTRNLYQEAWAGIRLLSWQGQLIVGTGAIYYRALLKEIERIDYQVLTTRPRLPFSGKIWLLLCKWPSFVWPSLAHYFWDTSGKTRPPLGSGKQLTDDARQTR